MEQTTTLRANQQFMAQLQECAKQLAEKLQSDNYEEASQLIHGLIEARDNHIFNKVGKLTRALHSAIVNFNIDGAPDHSEIRDATDRLQYVIDMTQSAADKTMDKVEEIVPIAMNLNEESIKLQSEWHRLKRRELDKDAFKQLYHRVDDFLGQMGDGCGQLNNNLQEIVLEQGFQDLTGQVLKKVIGLVRDVETELVDLMRIAGQVEEVTGLADENNKERRGAGKGIAAEGPQINASSRADVVNSQDDVDDLLSSLGF